MRMAMKTIIIIKMASLMKKKDDDINESYGL